MKKSLLITAISLLFFLALNFGQVPNLGSLAGFVLFTTTGAVGNTGTSQIGGHIGTNAGAITGFDPPTTVTGTIYDPGTVTSQGVTDLNAAYTQLFNTAPTSTTHTPAFGSGETLTAGVYSIGAAGSVAGVLNLDGETNPNAIFIFKFGGEFTTGASATINLLNGASARNVFWIAEGAIPMAAGTVMKGTLIANNGAISMAAGGSLEGRMFSTTGAVAVDAVILSIPAAAVLPVTLMDFKAIRINNAIELAWTTASEFSVARFDLQRSPDGSHFNNIASIPATNTSTAKTYKWPDNSPLAGISFYRLKMMDINDVFKYSAVLRINKNAEKSSAIYPNPITGHIMQLPMYGQLKGAYIINVYNLNGGKVMSSKITHDGNDGARSIRFDKNLSNAVYYLEIKDPVNNKQVFKVFIQ